jgi:electron transfer flavoprotein beta subunit
VLAGAINKMGDVQLALFGRQAIDGDTGNTPGAGRRQARLDAAHLRFGHQELDLDGGTITVERLVSGGKETVTAPLPVVMSVVKEINEPRYPSFMGIRKANRATIPTWTAGDITSTAGAERAGWTGPSLSPAAARYVGGDDHGGYGRGNG